MVKEGIDMGLFFDDEFMENSKKLEVSTNYHFCNRYLPGLLFYKPVLFLEAINNAELLDKLLDLVVSAMEEDGFDVTGFEHLNHWVKLDKTKGIMGIVIEIPNPQIEPECNFVCLVFSKKEPILYESELYDDGVFGLCARTRNGEHMNYGVTNDIKTPEQMWESIITL